jgi:hypothetical protein
MSSKSTKGIIYGYGVQAGMGTAVAVSAGLRVRGDAGLQQFDSGMEPINTGYKDGRWGGSDYDTAAGIKKPGWTGAPLMLTPALIGTLLDQVCDSSVVTTDTVYVNFDTEVNPVATKYLTLVRRNLLALTKGERLTDAVVKSIKLSSSESANLVSMDVDFLASEYEHLFDATAGTYTAPTTVPLFHKGVTFKIGSTATQCPEYDLTLDFGVVPIVDNAAKPQEFLLTKFKASGIVRIPWADEDVVADFMNQASNTLTFLWGVAGASGYLEIIIPVKYTKPDQDSDNETRFRQGIPFESKQTDAVALFTAKLHA